MLSSSSTTKKNNDDLSSGMRHPYVRQRSGLSVLLQEPQNGNGNASSTIYQRRDFAGAAVTPPLNNYQNHGDDHHSQDSGRLENRFDTRRQDCHFSHNSVAATTTQSDLRKAYERDTWRMYKRIVTERSSALCDDTDGDWNGQETPCDAAQRSRIAIVGSSMEDHEFWHAEEGIFVLDL